LAIVEIKFKYFYKVYYILHVASIPNNLVEPRGNCMDHRLISKITVN